MSVHYFHEGSREAMRAEAEKGDCSHEASWVRIFIDGAVIVLFPDGSDAFARAQRIADAINEGGRADAAPVE